MVEIVKLRLLSVIVKRFLLLHVTAEPRGAKTEHIERTIAAMSGEFRVADLQQLCPGVSLDMIRHVLKQLRAAGVVECLARGPAAPWRAVGTNSGGGD